MAMEMQKGQKYVETMEEQTVLAPGSDTGGGAHDGCAGLRVVSGPSTAVIRIISLLSESA